METVTEHKQLDANIKALTEELEIYKQGVEDIKHGAFQPADDAIKELRRRNAERKNTQQ